MGYTEPELTGDERMTILLGVDTGGTYTDAVLIRDDTDVIASAKSLTTRADLALGIGSAVRAVLWKCNFSTYKFSNIQYSFWNWSKKCCSWRVRNVF